MDVATVETQKADAMNVLSSQFGVQEQMLKHQHETQLKVLDAEKDRAIPDEGSVRPAVHDTAARDRAGVQAADLAALDGEDPARNGHPAAGRADDGPGQAVRDGRGDAEADGERL